MRFTRSHFTRALLAWTVVLIAGRVASADELTDIYRELIQTDTTHAAGSTTAAAELAAKRLLAAGLPASDVQVLFPPDRPMKGNLVARLRGTGARPPLLLLAHLDVVDARREDWTTDPFQLVEKDGFFYGRGTTDDKAMAAIWVDTLVRLARAGAHPDRDLIVALTADEESGPDNGVAWLLAKHKNLVEAAFVLNEGGAGQIKDGRYVANEVQVAEKVYANFKLEVTNPGGHSSRPTRDNAIVHLAAGLARLGAHEFPVELDDTTRAMFASLGRIPGMKDAADLAAMARKPAPALGARLAKTVYYNALMRTTCVPTIVEAGHAVNALPQRARANVNCRILPGKDPKAVQATLIRVLADPLIKVTQDGEIDAAGPSALTPEILQPIVEVTKAMWPGVDIVPAMSTGATDGRYFRAAGVPCFGVSGLFGDMDDVRAHGRDERMGVKQLAEGDLFLRRLVARLSGLPEPAP